MKIIRAEIKQADVVGRVHSDAWKQAYADVFPEDFLNEDTSERRAQEFLEACGCKNISYYIVYEEDKTVGIVKVRNESNVYELESFYILKQYRNKGYGRQVIAHLKKEFDKKRMQLWVLEDNAKARSFYENNGFKNTGKTRMIYRGKPFRQLQYELLPEVWAY